MCWALDALFNGLDARNPRLLFKGGTSLSKAFGLIQRFSEDIDITVFREDTVAPIRLRGVDTQELSSRVAEHVNLIAATGRLVILNVDGGGVGGGVVDRLRALGFDVNDVQFGSKAMDAKKYVNRRAEMWGLMRDWLGRGAVPKDEELAVDLTNVEYSFNKNDQIQLERKESMKARGLASPDNADALALTFAVPVPVPVLDLMVSRASSGRRQGYGEHDSIALAEAEMRQP